MGVGLSWYLQLETIKCMYVHKRKDVKHYKDYTESKTNKTFRF